MTFLFECWSYKWTLHVKHINITNAHSGKQGCLDLAHGMVKDGLGCAWVDHRCTKNELDAEFMIDQKLLVDWSRSTAKCLLHQSMIDGPVRSWKPNTTTGWIYNVDCITRLHYTFVYLGKKKEEVVSTFFLLLWMVSPCRGAYLRYINRESCPIHQCIFHVFRVIAFLNSMRTTISSLWTWE